MGGSTTTYNQTTTYEYDLSNQMTGATVVTPTADEQTGVVTDETDTNINVYNEAGQRMSKTEEVKKSGISTPAALSSTPRISTATC